MRRLNIIPIIHSRQDLGSLSARVDELKSETFPLEKMRTSRDAVVSFWREIRNGIENSGFEFRNLLIYQDGLPNTGRPDLLIERRIVDDLASSGSANHQLVQWLIGQGATLVGTESTELLLKEYDVVRKSLAEGVRFYDCNDDGLPSLCTQRDRYIADRVISTLGENQTGVIFLGLLHRIEPFLSDDIQIAYPFGRPSERLLKTCADR